MSTPVYRHGSRKGGTLLLLILGGIAGQVLVVFLLSALGWRDRLGMWALLLACLPLIAAVVIGVVIYSRDNRERHTELAQRLLGHGFVFQAGTDLAAKEQFCAPLAQLFPGVGRHGLIGTFGRPPAEGIEWFAVQQGVANPARLFEHAFRTGTGKQAQTVEHTILAWPAGHPDVRDSGLATSPWSAVSSFPKVLRKITERGGNADAAFAALYDKRCIAHDPATVKRFLTPGVIAELQRAPDQEAWYFGHGWVLCVFGSTLDGKNIDPFVTHARTVARATTAG